MSAERKYKKEGNPNALDLVLELTGKLAEGNPFLQEKFLDLESILKQIHEFNTKNFERGQRLSSELALELLNGRNFGWWDIEEYKKRVNKIREVTSSGQFVNVLGNYALQRIAGEGPLLFSNHSDLFPASDGVFKGVFLDALTNATVTNMGADYPDQMLAATAVNLLVGGVQCPAYHPGPLMEEAAKALISVYPSKKDGTKVAWFNSGGDAVSVAIAAAEKYTEITHGENGRRKAVYFKEAYHGNIEGRAGKTTSGINQMFHKEDLNSIELEYPNQEGEIDPSLKMINDLIEDKKLSCVIFETTQGDGGGISMHPNFFVKLIKMSLDKKIPLIIDEVQSGFGRSNRVFDVEYLLDYWRESDYVKNQGYPENPPFFLAVAKSMTNGAVPGSALIIPQEYDVLDRAQGLNTYSAHPTTLAATIATIENLPEILSIIQQKRKIFNDAIEPFLDSELIQELRGHGLHLFVALKNTQKTNYAFFSDEKMLNYPAIRAVIEKKLKGFYNNEEDFYIALESAKLSTLIQIVQTELLGRKRVLVGTVSRGALRVHAPINAPDEVWQALGTVIGEVIKNVEDGNVSEEVFRILQGGPSGLAVR